MLGDGFLNFQREHIFSTNNDDVFEAVHDVEVAIVVDACDVSGPVPRAHKRIPGRFRIVEIFFHTGIGLEPDLTGFAGTGIGLVGLDDAHIDPSIA